MVKYFSTIGNIKCAVHPFILSNIYLFESYEKFRIASGQSLIFYPIEHSLLLKSNYHTCLMTGTWFIALIWKIKRIAYIFTCLDLLSNPVISVCSPYIKNDQIEGLHCRLGKLKTTRRGCFSILLIK